MSIYLYFRDERDKAAFKTTVTTIKADIYGLFQLISKGLMQDEPFEGRKGQPEMEGRLSKTKKSSKRNNFLKSNANELTILSQSFEILWSKSQHPYLHPGKWFWQNYIQKMLYLIKATTKRRLRASISESAETVRLILLCYLGYAVKCPASADLKVVGRNRPLATTNKIASGNVKGRS